MNRALTAVVALAALVALAAAPAGAQIPDVPELGFEIDPLEGPVGSTVDGLVDTDDVAEHCITDPVEFVAQIIDPSLAEDTPYIEAVLAYLDEAFVGDEDLAEDPHLFATVVALFFTLGLVQDLNDPDGGELVEGALAQTFVMAFADLETASPIEPLGNFDRNTGEGQVDVPDIEAGFHPVIATCVGLPEVITVDDIANAVAVGTAFVEENFEPPFPDNLFAPEFAEVAGQVAPVILQELVEPHALGFEFFCVFDDSGQCPDDGPPPVNGNGDDEPGPARPVVVDPTFTG